MFKKTANNKINFKLAYIKFPNYLATIFNFYAHIF